MICLPIRISRDRKSRRYFDTLNWIVDTTVTVSISNSFLDDVVSTDVSHAYAPQAANAKLLILSGARLWNLVID
jgi:hypothetical protein